MKILIQLVILFVLLSSGPAISFDDVYTVRLGGKIIEPGLSSYVLLKKAGEPVHKEEFTYHGSTGEIWYYEKGFDTYAIYIYLGKVLVIKKVDM